VVALLDENKRKKLITEKFFPTDQHIDIEAAFRKVIKRNDAVRQADCTD
jgi:hypothetical protein